MDKAQKPVITIESLVNAPLEKVWSYWTEPDHITKWNFASEDWHSPWAKNDLRKGGSFSARMEAKDSSIGFDFGGVYDEVITNEYIEYTMGDSRKVKIQFSKEGNATRVVEQFEAESVHPTEVQKKGWQAILDNFTKYTENN